MMKVFLCFAMKKSGNFKIPIFLVINMRAMFVFESLQSPQVKEKEGTGFKLQFVAVKVVCTPKVLVDGAQNTYLARQGVGSLISQEKTSTNESYSSS